MSFNFTVKEFILGNGTGTPTLQFYKRGFNLGGSAEPSRQDIILSGNTALTLVNAKEDGLNYLKLFGGTEQLSEQYLNTVTLSGGCEQSGTPTPDTPIDIVCNNGVVKFSPNLFNKNNTLADGRIWISKGQQSSYAGFYGANPISVQGGMTYTRTAGTGSDNFFLLENNTYVTVSSSSNTITVPNNAVLWFFNYATSVSRDEAMVVKGNALPNTYFPYATNGIYTDGTQEVVTDSLGNTASAERLLAVGNYKDTQEVLSGSVTRNIGIKVLDGTEDWLGGAYFILTLPDMLVGSYNLGFCTHFTVRNSSLSLGDIQMGSNDIYTYWFERSNKPSGVTDMASWKQFLADQYANGTPVIIVYPLATATTSTVSGQFLSKSPVTQTAGSISNLPIAITESSHTTPTPQQPLQINCNNGVVKTTAPLPQSYTALEYIESTGTQYINSNVSYASGDSLRAVADMQFTNITGSQFFGIYASAYCGVSGNGFVIGGYRVITANTNRHIFDLYSDIGGTNTVTLEIDGTPYTYSRNTDPGNFVILGLNGTTICSAKLYSIKLYKNDNLVFDGIPAKRNSDSVIGMYDAVSQTFFTNAGTGAFTTGSELPFIYTDGTTETVEITGKNLFDVSDYNEASDWTPAAYRYVEIPLPNGTYTVSWDKTKGAPSIYWVIQVTESVVGTATAGSGGSWLWHATVSSLQKEKVTFTVTEGKAWFSCNFGNAFNNFLAMLETVQIELGSTATAYEPYTVLGTATAENLFKVGTYQDVQSVIDGGVTRNVGVKVLDGTEDWAPKDSYGRTTILILNLIDAVAARREPAYCNYFENLHNSEPISNVHAGQFYVGTNKSMNFHISQSTTDEFKSWLADQYNAGTPVIIVYPISSPTTETVTAQPLTTQAGTNIVEITQASIDNLGLEVSYKATV